MNQGLHGFGIGAMVGGGLPFVQGVAFSQVNYTVSGEPTSDTTIKGSDGVTTMSVRLQVDRPGILVARFAARAGKSGGYTRTALYQSKDGAAAVKVFPNANVGAPGWYSERWESGTHETSWDHVAAILAGTYVWDVRHQAALDTANITWTDRMLMVQVLPLIEVSL